MKAVDTNILLRFVLQDDAAQFAAASAFLRKRAASDPAFVSLIVLTEFIWTLRRRYQFGREEARILVLDLLESAELEFEDEESLAVLVAGADQGDLADHLIAYVARRAGCSSTVTFDRDAARAIHSMELLA